MDFVVQRALEDAADLPSVFVIDDGQSVAAHGLRQVATALLDELAPGSQLVIASRTEPPLPIGRLRAHRALVEVRTNDLAMTPAEAATLLRQAGLELDFGAVQTLSGQTEGWPVGALSGGAVASRPGRRRRAVSSGFAGDDHLIAEYFRDEFLAELSPELRAVPQPELGARRALGSGVRRGARADRVGGHARRAGTIRNLMLIPRSIAATNDSAGTACSGDAQSRAAAHGTRARASAARARERPGSGATAISMARSGTPSRQATSRGPAICSGRISLAYLAARP